MNRNDYLDKAQKTDLLVATPALDIARSFSTTKDLKSAATQLEAEIARHAKKVRIANRLLELESWLLVSFVVTGVLASIVTSSLNLQTAWVVSAWVGAYILMGWCLITVQSADEARVLKLLQLQPIAGTPACLEALKLIETGYAEVLAWRDLAIAERGQLYGFDVGVMERLKRGINLELSAAAELRNRAEQEAQEALKLAEACRKVHGLSAVDG